MGRLTSSRPELMGRLTSSRPELMGRLISSRPDREPTGEVPSTDEISDLAGRDVYAGRSG
jgi:hypothetical protein